MRSRVRSHWFFYTTVKDLGRKLIAAHSDSDLELGTFAPAQQ
jgi:hypothetical protein